MNKPMLFVNSVSVENNNDKAEVFDSRKAKKKTIKIHRLDDALAFIKLGKKVYITVITKNSSLSGEIKNITDNHIIFGTNKVLLNEILDLTINLVK